jgi:hypothetical protein
MHEDAPLTHLPDAAWHLAILAAVLGSTACCSSIAGQQEWMRTSASFSPGRPCTYLCGCQSPGSEPRFSRRDSARRILPRWMSSRSFPLRVTPS